ncbi:uncharacterized protein TNCV_1463831 [Trichonephila clavipes]|nr:uncharacterized protein TNCV_1463831 [Trichonephila clavipes]
MGDSGPLNEDDFIPFMIVYNSKEIDNDEVEDKFQLLTADLVSYNYRIPYEWKLNNFWPHHNLTFYHILSATVAEWYRYRIVAGLVTSYSPVPLKIRRVGQRCTLNLSRAETSSRWCGVVVRSGVTTGIPFTHTKSSITYQKGDKVARWIGKFQQGRVSTSDEQRSGRSVNLRTDLARAVIEQLMDYIKGHEPH